VLLARVGVTLDAQALEGEGRPGTTRLRRVPA